MNNPSALKTASKKYKLIELRRSGIGLITGSGICEAEAEQLKSKIIYII
jgi:hypothetical protein